MPELKYPKLGKINLQWLAGDPAPADPVPADPAVDPVADPAAEPAKTFSQSDLDKAIQKAIKTNETNLRKKVETEAAEKARIEKLSAEEKLAEQQKQIDSDRKSIQVDRNKAKAERLFATAKIDADIAATLLESIVTDEEETSMARVQTIIDTIAKTAETIAQDKIKAAMLDVKPPKGGGAGTIVAKDIELATRAGKAASEQDAKSKEILSKYYQ